MTEKKLSITNHQQGWGVVTQRRGSIHFWKKNSWKSICGHETLNDISDRWKARFFPKNNNNFPERKKCQRCLKFMGKNGITDY